METQAIRLNMLTLSFVLPRSAYHMGTHIMTLKLEIYGYFFTAALILFFKCISCECV